jgi:hypothetical protein
MDFAEFVKRTSGGGGKLKKGEAARTPEELAVRAMIGAIVREIESARQTLSRT